MTATPKRERRRRLYPKNGSGSTSTRLLGTNLEAFARVGPANLVPTPLLLALRGDTSCGHLKTHSARAAPPNFGGLDSLMDFSVRARIQSPHRSAAHFVGGEGGRRRPAASRVSFRPMASAASVEEPAAAAAVAAAETKRGPSGASFIREHLRSLAPYQPILPFEVLSARLGRKPEDIIKLDANENPYGPPPEVAKALGNLKFPYVYPDPESRQLRAALAEDSGLESEYILAGCGADELIDLIMRCVLEPGDKIVDCPPTFTMYEFDASVNGALVIKDVAQIVKVVEQEKPKCIFLTSPNNPDGSIINDEDLLKILDLPILVVLDEAYIEFSSLQTRMSWVKKHDNLIVLRTFSKRAGLAGLRVGYGAFPLSIIEYLWRAKQPYNVSVAAEVSACAALQNPTYLEEDLAKMGVMIRHYDKKELKGYIRISVGKPEHTDALMKGLKALQL
uniref:histidinol-phosphate transaminase n=1 Tax=Oryza meridionalis TaxID=40149 RepID=A0A0E0CQH0_9ORYZ